MPKKYHHGDLKNALIQAGVEILAKEGVGGLSLRKVAQRAGVSHSAPYAHFPDKQSLIAAISTEGFNQLYAELEAAISSHSKNPKKQLIEGVQAYVHFAMENLDTFKIMFSGVLEKEKDYSSFVDISSKTFKLVVEVVQACQNAGVLPAAPADLMAVSVWGQVHGIVSLALEGQVSHTVLDKHSIQDIVLVSIEQLINS
ncbi:MAG: TetR/AcrR family transcriptional regulator [Anaerolineales bacterium]|jgi:AcrR family transcriptional regulator|nr:TetR/AcrR family transcriptional regulator [Chloroflexota bacterium]MBK6646157.1 TetR/AcrR family transcriptional regulator [Anaerolineales bacterium]